MQCRWSTQISLLEPAALKIPNSQSLKQSHDCAFLPLESKRDAGTFSCLECLPQLLAQHVGLLNCLEGTQVKPPTEAILITLQEPCSCSVGVRDAEDLSSLPLSEINYSSNGA